ncbi:MAG: dipeptidase [Devosia sp.]
MTDTHTPKTPFFDGHNDVLSKLQNVAPARAVDIFTSGGDLAIDLPKAKAGGLMGGLFAVWIPSAPGTDFSFDDFLGESYAIPLPPEIAVDDALREAVAQVALLMRLEEAGALKVCRTVGEIEAAHAEGVMAAVLHVEGAEPIDRDLFFLDVLYGAGLRSLGPLWSRPNRYGHGVPFLFPGGPDTGEGLTADGHRLVARCNQLRIMIDLSHLNEAGFWDVAKRSTAPLVATHSNAFTLCNSPRNLTDKQLDAIAESDGMVGLNFAVAFLREDGQMRADTPLDAALTHLDYLIERIGEDRVGFGSDYDGTVVPEAITGSDALPRLADLMRAHGYDDALMDKLCHRNWMRVLRKTWHE